MDIKLSDIYKHYISNKSLSKQEKSNIKTALFKYTLPGLGFVMPRRSAKRLNPGDIQLAIAFCNDIYLDADSKKNLTQSQEDYFKKYTPGKALVRHNRRVLKEFTNFIDETVKQNSLPPRKKYKPAKIAVDDLSHVESNRLKRKRKEYITLSFDYKDYSDSKSKVKEELKRIGLEINQFVDYLENLQSSKFSKLSSKEKVKSLLGWQYLETKDLTKVGLEQLIVKHNIYPQRKNNPDISKPENYINYMVSKAEAIDQGKEYAKETIEWVINFFEKYEIDSRQTKITYISTLVNVAKYLYKDISDKDENSNYEDISVVKRLRVLSAKIPKDDKKIQVDLPSWETIIKVLYELKRSADQEYSLNNNYNNKRNPVLDSAKAFRLQRFLILGFLTLVPPCRQRIVRELKLGKTLEYGNYINNVFIPFMDLENKSEANFYIHLLPEDYKTGKKYGEWLGEFPNFKFSDGTNFYDYLNLWIIKYRNIMLDSHIDHGYLFMTSRAKKPFEKYSLCSLVCNIFDSLIKTRLSPHKLRTIYRTHLADIGADQKTLESSAFWMRHSVEMAKDTYTKQSLVSKLAPGVEAIAKINSKILN